MDKLLAELNAIFAGVTIKQRRELKISVGLSDDYVDVAVVATLVDLGLVVKAGDTYCATPAGGYVSRLY